MPVPGREHFDSVAAELNIPQPKTLRSCPARTSSGAFVIPGPSASFVECYPDQLPYILTDNRLSSKAPAIPRGCAMAAAGSDRTD